MIDVPDDLDRCELVPGVSEHRWSRITRVVVGVLSIMSGVMIFVVTKALQNQSGVSTQGLVAVAAGFGLPVLVLIGLTIVRGRRGNLEAAAGYTTLTNGRLDLNQLDPITGVVLRRAGSVIFRKPKHDAAAGGTTSGPSTYAPQPDSVVRFVDDPPSPLKTVAIWGLVTIGIGMIAVALSLVNGSSHGQSADDLSFPQLGRIVLGGCGILVALTLGGAAVSHRAKLRAARRVRPDACVFLTQRTPQLLDALRNIRADRPRLPQYFAVTLGTQGIELWGRKRSEVPRFVLPWKDIEYVHPGRLSVEFAQDFSVTVQALHFFQSVDGRPIDLPFTMLGPRGFNRAATRDANKILSACSRFTKIR
ncbi:hypothetical protein BJQ94_01465 [Cryobacterium sp. SO2]|uniref:hypothetical protein n=1 Tax=Cryobacterium sp. SO2 TaxID=1897060 RepID=UPI00223D65C5|nr:hypothetical protein [Cryobacterium sp. SO2]WEO77745.1 hypothetical protein BJQ94_01465 [Cryobacterium sp. SO2]